MRGNWYQVTNNFYMFTCSSKLTTHILFKTVKTFTKLHFTLAGIGNEKLLPLAILHH
jgi:hypothetical protein